MKSLPVASSPVGVSWMRDECAIKTVTFLAQGVKLVEERWDMHNDARADDAGYGRINQSCTTKKREGVVDYLAMSRG